VMLCSRPVAGDAGGCVTAAVGVCIVICAGAGGRWAVGDDIATGRAVEERTVSAFPRGKVPLVVSRSAGKGTSVVVAAPPAAPSLEEQPR
jgi:hypothetical protein